jgi:hypothetical protein
MLRSQLCNRAEAEEVASSVQGGNPAQGIPCGGTETVVASPALYIDY